MQCNSHVYELCKWEFNLLWALTETWSLVVSFSLSLSHQSHCLIMNLNVSLYNTFSFSSTYPPVIMSFPGKNSWNHIPQWWGERLLFLEEEEIFVTLITYKSMLLRTVHITVSLSLGALCHLLSFCLHGNWEHVHKPLREQNDMNKWGHLVYEAIKSKCKMNHPFAGQWCSLMQFSAWS